MCRRGFLLTVDSLLKEFSRLRYRRFSGILDDRTVPFYAERNRETKLTMKFLATAVTSALLLVQPVSHALADELDTLVDILAMKTATIKVVSENCGVSVDPMLEGRVMEALVRVPSIYMSDVMSNFAQSYENEKHARGSNCFSGNVEALATSKRIYDMHIKDLRKLVEEKYGQ